MGQTGWVDDPRFDRHDTGPGHPETPRRLPAVRQALEDAGLTERLDRVAPRPATDAELEAVHDPAYVARVAGACAGGKRVLDSMDTAIVGESEAIARLASGAMIELCEEVADGKMATGFAAMRPPGHHAERDQAMGFCLFNHVAVAARALQRSRGIERVLIVDWDVHHGNGTQHIFEEDPGVFYFSVHQSPLYPGTGAADERGIGAGEGTTLNCPLPPGADDERYLATLVGPLTEAAAVFKPAFVLVSAGFDAHRDDPLANLEVSTEAFGEATRIVRGIADEHAAGRCVSLLEGGYDLTALGASVACHVTAMLD